MWIAALLLLAYAALVALVWFKQGSMIYPAPPVRADTPPGFERVVYPTPDGLELVAGYRSARDGMPTLLFFHGNGSDWQSSAMVTEKLAAQGYGVLAAEYRGYAGNPGAPSETGLYEDARGAWKWLIAQGVATDDVVLVGNSIGSGVAVHLATEIEPGALVLVSPFDSLEETASRKLRWLPVRTLLRDRYDNASKLPGIAAPVLILHGEADSLIGVDQARALAAARPHTEIETYPGWGHALIVNEAVQDRIAAFLAAD